MGGTGVSQLGLYLDLRLHASNLRLIETMDSSCLFYIYQQVYGEALNRLIARMVDLGQLQPGTPNAAPFSRGFARDLIAAPSEVPEHLLKLRNSLIRNAQGWRLPPTTANDSPIFKFANHLSLLYTSQSLPNSWANQPYSGTNTQNTALRNSLLRLSAKFGSHYFHAFSLTADPPPVINGTVNSLMVFN